MRLTWGAAIDETAPERLEYKVVWSYIPEDIDTTWKVRAYEGRSVGESVMGGVVLDWTPGTTSVVAAGEVAYTKYYAVVVRDVGPYPDDPSADALRGMALYGPTKFPPED